MNFKKDEIIFLFGAGASFDAAIPISEKMIEDIEQLIMEDNQWKEYKDFYNLIKSSIIYADGVQGKFGEKVNFNIERLFNVLIELEKKEEHPLYPFIGQWNIKFSEIIRDDFRIIGNFKALILNELKKWISLEKKENANYYSSLKNFRKDYNYSLRIFTLNYDLCVETALLLSKEFKIERGFNEKGIWDYRKFNEIPEDAEPDIFLYKLHGSIDWERNTATGEVKYKDEISRIKTPDLIFGDIYKLQYVDPYLFQFYELRKHTLLSKLIIIIGYGFADEHINGILSQALKQDNERKILYISPNANEENIIKILGLRKNNQIEVKTKGAKEYFKNELKIKKLEQLFRDEQIDEFWN